VIGLASHYLDSRVLVPTFYIIPFYMALLLQHFICSCL
jgi:hypothetical protein